MYSFFGRLNNASRELWYSSPGALGLDSFCRQGKTLELHFCKALIYNLLNIITGWRDFLWKIGFRSRNEQNLYGEAKLWMCDSGILSYGQSSSFRSLWRIRWVQQVYARICPENINFHKLRTRSGKTSFKGAYSLPDNRHSKVLEDCNLLCHQKPTCCRVAIYILWLSLVQWGAVFQKERWMDDTKMGKWCNE